MQQSAHDRDYQITAVQHLAAAALAGLVLLIVHKHANLRLIL